MRHIRDVVEQFPEVQRFHWVMDNLNTHYTVKLCQYLGRLSGVWETRPPLRTGAQRRAFLTDTGHTHVVHYTPKHGSWLNQVEIWFGVLNRRLLRRGDFHSAEELAERVRGFIAYYDRHYAPLQMDLFRQASGQRRCPKRENADPSPAKNACEH